MPGSDKRERRPPLRPDLPTRKRNIHVHSTGINQQLRPHAWSTRPANASSPAWTTSGDGRSAHASRISRIERRRPRLQLRGAVRKNASGLVRSRGAQAEEVIGAALHTGCLGAGPVGGEVRVDEGPTFSRLHVCERHAIRRDPPWSTEKRPPGITPGSKPTRLASSPSRICTLQR